MRCFPSGVQAQHLGRNGPWLLVASKNRPVHLRDSEHPQAGAVVSCVSGPDVSPLRPTRMISLQRLTAVNKPQHPFNLFVTFRAGTRSCSRWMLRVWSACNVLRVSCNQVKELVKKSIDIVSSLCYIPSIYTNRRKRHPTWIVPVINCSR